MRETGPVWIVIFFLLVIFILLNTVSIEQTGANTKAELRSLQGISLKADIDLQNRPEQLPPQLSEDEVVFQAFSLNMQAPERAQVIIDVPTSWLEHRRIDENTVSLYLLQNDTWTDVQPQARSSFSKQYTLTTTAEDGLYLITGIKNSDKDKKSKLPNLRVQVAILALLCLVLLFIGYHHQGQRERRTNARMNRKQEREQRIEGYIRKAIMENRSDEEIRAKLLSAGWDPEEVDQALRRARFF